MFSTVILPLDGSTLARRAIPYAVKIARAARGRLILFQALSAGESYDHAMAVLDAVADQLSKDGVATVARVRFGDAAKLILDTALSEQDCLIVMSTRGRAGVERWLYGSVADEVLRKADVPVMLIPMTCERSWSADRSFLILIPLDGSDLAEEALGPIRAFADVFGADMLLLRAVPPRTFSSTNADVDPPNDPETELDEARRYLESLAITLRAEGRVVRTLAVIDFPVPAIARAAREQNVDLIAMATHGSGGLTRLVLGSVATGTVHQATVPLLFIRPEAIPQQELSPGVLLGLTPAESTRDAGV